MRRSRLVQTTAATLALLFLAALATEAYGLHPCPRHHHSGSSTEVAGPSVAPDAPGGDPAPPLCVCVGICHGGAASPVPAAPVARDLLPAPTSSVVDAPTERVRARDRGAYFLPFPNGPPLG